MPNFTLAPAATLAISGITPASGPTSTDRVNASYAPAPVMAVDDRVCETFTVNASTTATAINLGKISAGKFLWLECDGALHVTVTQDLGAGAVDITMKVDKFILLQSAFTAIKVANPSATTAVHMAINVGGDRPAVGGGAGVF